MLVIILLIVGVAISLLIGIGVDKYSRYSEGTLFKVISVILGIVLSFLMFCIFVTYVGLEGNISRQTERYDSLVYQYENDFYENDNDIGKRELMLQIQDWNEDLAEGKAMKDNKWIGILYPDKLYNSLDFIEIEKSEEE